MRTYRIPALGLEVMSEDVKPGKAMDLIAEGWRPPTLEEISLIWDLGKLGVLSIANGWFDVYLYQEKDDIWTGLYPQLGARNLITRRRYVRDI